MDELEILKRDWKNKENSFNQVSEKQIYRMLHKRSSSIVKWILIISILEILFWSVLNFFTSDEKYLKTLEMYHLKTAMSIISFFNYAVIACFIYLFYKNYKTINTTDSVMSLMKNIINTRQMVKYYVWYNLGMTFVLLILVFTFQFIYDPNIQKLVDQVTQNMNETTFYVIAFLFYAVVSFVFLFLIWLFYRLLYGILLKRLLSNYNELKKIDL